MNIQRQTYKQLELIPDGVATNAFSGWQIFWSLLRRFVFARNCLTIYGFEIHPVSQSGASRGWYAYNPTLERMIYLESDQDLQRWLEELVNEVAR